MAQIPLRYVPISPFIDESDPMQRLLDALEPLLDGDLAVDHAKLCVRRLLEFCGRSRPDGMLGAMSARRLADAVSWRLGTPTDFLRACIESGWLLEDAEGLRVGGWEEGGGRAIAKRQAWASQKAEQRHREKERLQKQRTARQRQRQAKAESSGGPPCVQGNTARNPEGSIKRHVDDKHQNCGDAPEHHDLEILNNVPVNHTLAASLAVHGSSSECPAGRSAKIKAKTKSEIKFLKTKKKLSFSSIEEMVLAGERVEHAMSALEAENAVARLTQTATIAPRHRATLASLSPVASGALSAAARRAVEICTDSQTELNAGLIISCLERAQQRPAECSRIGRIWQRGMQTLLLDDSAAGL